MLKKSCLDWWVGVTSENYRYCYSGLLAHHQKTGILLRGRFGGACTPPAFSMDDTSLSTYVLDDMTLKEKKNL